jgi:hypothetical protein
MKTFITLACLCLIGILGCKKSSDGTPSSQAAVQVEVSGLTTKTALNLRITDVTMGNIVILDLSNKFGNTTYTTSKVNSVDHLIVVYSTNIPDDLQGDGDGTLSFSYKGIPLWTSGGILTGNTTLSIP